MSDMSDIIWKSYEDKFESLRNDPKRVEKFTDFLFEIAKRKAMEEHQLDMVTALSLAYLLTKGETSPRHAIILDLMRKYHISEPPEAESLIIGTS